MIVIDTLHFAISTSRIFPNAICGYPDNPIFLSSDTPIPGRKMSGRIERLSDRHFRRLSDKAEVSLSVDAERLFILFDGRIVITKGIYSTIASLSPFHQAAKLDVDVQTDSLAEYPDIVNPQLGLALIELEPGATVVTKQGNDDGDASYVVYQLNSRGSYLREEWGKDLLCNWIEANSP